MRASGAERFFPARAELRDRREAEVRPVRDLLPLINCRGADLLENERLVLQLVQLERRTARGGRDNRSSGRGPRRRSERGGWCAGDGGEGDGAASGARPIGIRAPAATARSCNGGEVDDVAPSGPTVLQCRASAQFPSYTRATHTCPTAKTLNARGIRTARGADGACLPYSTTYARRRRSELAAL